MAEKFRILAADKLAKQGLEWIQSQPDAELVNKPGLSEDEYAELIQSCHAMIVRSGIKVTAKMLDNPGSLKVIARAGVGVDNIDLEASTSKGILVVNSAEASTLTTCEHAFTLMMAMARNVGPAYMKMHSGGWDRSKYQGTQLAGKTVGIVGFGRIGRAFAERALAFEMDVIAYDPFVNTETALDGKVKMYRSFDEMLPHCDVVSFHVPLNDQTRGMLNKETFKLARPNLLVVNAARGGVVDEADLIAALDAGQCAGAAIDVYSKEPPPEDSPLRTHPKVLVTPHLGASTAEAQEAVSLDAAAAALTYLRGEGIKGAVNAGNLRVDLSPIQKGFADLAERMATLISPMITRGIATVAIELTGSQLASAAGTVERMAMIQLLRRFMNVPLNVINVNQIAESRGIKVKTVTVEDAKSAGPQLAITVQGPAGAVDDQTHEADKVRRIVGRMYDDMKPRIVEINGYFMDMVPAGHMVLIQNEDRPGMVGLVGTEFGKAGVNIADMSISRRDNTALMVLKIDAPPSDSLLDSLKANTGILKVATVRLMDEQQ